MKNLKTYKLFEAKKDIGTLTSEQVEWLNECTYGTWQVNPQTGLVDVKGDFGCRRQNLSNLVGVRFGVVRGDFDCFDNKLTSLEGAPQEVGWGFNCGGNKLTSLEGAPQEVGEDFDCSFNELTSLEGAPQVVRGSFDCSFNELTSLEGAPQVVRGSFGCTNNELTSLAGAPQEVGGNFLCSHNKLTSLEGAPQVVRGKFECNEFETKEWNPKGWLEILKRGGKAAALILTILTEGELDKWMLKNPLDLDLLDKHPKIKKGVLARTGMRDTSVLARNMRKGII